MMIKLILMLVFGFTIGFVMGALFASYMSIKESYAVDAEWESVE